ncbi:MAG: hypothetical protein Q9218_007829 [Villophora microphyllina]
MDDKGNASRVAELRWMYYLPKHKDRNIGDLYRYRNEPYDASIRSDTGNASPFYRPSAGKYAEELEEAFDHGFDDIFDPPRTVNRRPSSNNNDAGDLDDKGFVDAVETRYFNAGPPLSPQEHNAQLEHLRSEPARQPSEEEEESSDKDRNTKDCCTPGDCPELAPLLSWLPTYQPEMGDRIIMISAFVSNEGRLESYSVDVSPPSSSSSEDKAGSRREWDSAWSDWCTYHAEISPFVAWAERR